MSTLYEKVYPFLLKIHLLAVCAYMDIFDLLCFNSSENLTQNVSPYQKAHFEIWSNSKSLNDVFIEPTQDSSKETSSSRN